MTKASHMIKTIHAFRKMHEFGYRMQRLTPVFANRNPADTWVVYDSRTDREVGAVHRDSAGKLEYRHIDGHLPEHFTRVMTNYFNGISESGA